MVSDRERWNILALVLFVVASCILISRAGFDVWFGIMIFVTANNIRQWLKYGEGKDDE